MTFITSTVINTQANFHLLSKLRTFTPFAMDGIFGKVNINALLLQTVLH